MRKQIRFLLIMLLLHFLTVTMLLAQPGLIAYYPFNGNAQDATGNGYNGMVSGATLTTDRFGIPGSAYSFDGIDDKIVIGKEPNFPSWNTYSVSLWFLNNGGGNQGQGYGQKILSKAQGETDFHLGVLNDGSQGRLSWWSAQGGFNAVEATNQDYRDNQWHHVVLNKQSPGSGDIWVDGVLQNSSSTLQAVFNNEDLVIGFTTHTDIPQQKHWSGKIDDIRIYNRVLAECEIAELFGEDVSLYTFYRDTDGDGYGDINSHIEYCTLPAGYVMDSSDCDDNDATISPGALEICDGKDNDCNGLIDDGLLFTTYYRDADNDGYGDINNSIQSCMLPAGYVLDNTDCDDNDINSHPRVTFYRDADGDSYGDINNSIQSCTLPDGFVLDNADCDDNNASAHPRKEKKVFIYTGADQPFTVPPNTHQITVKLWGAGGSAGAIGGGTGGGGGFVEGILNVTPGDQLTIIVGGGGETGAGPGSYGGGGAKLCGTGGRGGGRSAIRNSFNSELITAGAGGGGASLPEFGGFVSKGYAGGGLTGQGGSDYWDGKPGTQTAGGYVESFDLGGTPGGQFYGGYTECLNNGFSSYGNNGSGGSGYFGGSSGHDGFIHGVSVGGGGGGSSLVPPGGYTITGNDEIPGNINDQDYSDSAGYGGINATVGNPGRIVILWNINSVFYRDTDGDGFGNTDDSIAGCSQPAGYVTNNSDCNDDDSLIHPNASEICDGKDNDCNGIIDNGAVLTTYYQDADNDGHGNAANSVQNCSLPAGYVADNTDCNDNDATVFAGAIEICDSKDNDCNGLIDDGITLTTYYRDTDGDGYGNSANSVQNCSQPFGYVTNSTDCNDNDAAIHPGATEICDGKDNNCNGSTDEGVLTTYYRDADNDGYGNPGSSAQNCSPPAGFVTNNTDCNDNDASVHPGAELCGNSIDNNCNGIIDEGCAPIFVSPQPASINEGNKGKISITFTVRLNTPAITASSVNYQTVPVTATAGVDYLTKTGTVSFAKGQSSKTVVVKILGDQTPEPDETFNLVLSNPVNIALYQNTATGTIINDDGFALMNNQTDMKQQALQKAAVNNKLAVPNLLHKNELWRIPGLPLSNSVMVLDGNGKAILKANNYRNDKNFSSYSPGLYYYRIMIRDKDRKPEIYQGKLMIVP